MNLYIKFIISVFLVFISFNCYSELLITNLKLATKMVEIPIQTLTTPQTFEGEDNLWWDTFCDNLLLNPKQHIVLLVSGYGGDLLEVNKVVRTIERIKKEGGIVDMDVIGPAISGHAMVLVAASSLNMEPYTSIVFHAPGDYVSLLGGYITFRGISHDIEITTDCQYILGLGYKKGLLTTTNISDILNGNRVIILKDADNNGIKVITTYDYENDPTNLVFQLAYVVFLVSCSLIVIGLIKRI